jgi:glycosyltransferase involved in cell wall biosynthesis
MKICYFTNRFPGKNPITGEIICPSIDGGVESVVYNLTSQMVKKGHEVIVFTSAIGNNHNSIEDYGQVKIYRYAKSLTIGQAPISLNLLYKPLLQDIKFDVIHSHIGNLPAPLTAYLYAKKGRVPIIVTYHADWIGGFGSIKRKFCVFLFNNYLCNKLLSSSDIIIALSHHQVNESIFLRKHTGKIRAISNGINLKDFDVQFSKEECRNELKLPLDKNIILFVGTLTSIKGPHILLKSMSEIVEKFPNSYLVFVGDGYYKEELEKLAVQLNVRNNIKFAGFADDQCKILYYKSADIFVLPSFHESFGIVLLEASACGLPLVVSDLETFKAIVEEGHNGLSTKKGDDKDLAKKIIYLLENDDIRKSMGNNAREKVKGFSWERVAASTENVYLKLINEKT